MIVIVGLVVLLVAVIVGFTGVLTNAGAAHPLTENFSLFGYHVTGSTGTLFLVRDRGRRGGDAGTERVAGRGAAHRGPRARRPTRTKRSQRETAFLNQERDQRLEHQQAGAASGSPVNSEGATTRRNRVPLFGRWSRGRQPTGTAHVDGRR